MTENYVEKLKKGLQAMGFDKEGVEPIVEIKRPGQTLKEPAESTPGGHLTPPKTKWPGKEAKPVMDL